MRKQDLLDGGTIEGRMQTRGEQPGRDGSVTVQAGGRTPSSLHLPTPSMPWKWTFVPKKIEWDILF